MRFYYLLCCSFSVSLVEFCSVSSFQTGFLLPRKLTKIAAANGKPTKDEDAQDNDGEDDTTEPEAAKKKTSMTLVEYAERERKAGRQLENRLLLPNRIGKAITGALYTFIALGFLLELSGYGFVRTQNGISIGTLEEREFQREIMRVAKPTAPVAPATSDGIKNVIIAP